MAFLVGWTDSLDKPSKSFLEKPFAGNVPVKIKEEGAGHSSAARARHYPGQVLLRNVLLEIG